MLARLGHRHQCLQHQTGDRWHGETAGRPCEECCWQEQGTNQTVCKNDLVRNASVPAPPRRYLGPSVLLVTWLLHDLEEVWALPETCDYLAERFGNEALRIDTRQAKVAVGLMGVLVGFATYRGARSSGCSRLYQAVVAGLDSHIFTHLLASMAAKRYLAGAATALPVMLPDTRFAGNELAHQDQPLELLDGILGGALLFSSALASHTIARRWTMKA